MPLRGESGQQAPRPRRILFVCTGNTCRSPMAAALLYDRARRRELCSAVDPDAPPLPPMTVTSAGLYAEEGAPITPDAVRALREAGVPSLPDHDYAAHRARSVTPELMHEADEVIAISASHAMGLLMRFPECAAKITTLPLDISDPFGGDLERYRACLSEISYALSLHHFSFGEGES
ncbi:MAG: low molecular weight protein arginine phosphatase [Ruminococcaceae bacterium]|nr:low molecular weight protein arginine phosphatase [Oscillospiraceae bacterium]